MEFTLTTDPETGEFDLRVAHHGLLQYHWVLDLAQVEDLRDNIDDLLEAS